MPFLYAIVDMKIESQTRTFITFLFELTKIAIYYSHDVQCPPTKSLSEPVSQIWILKFKTN